jgi:hypothetical protein
LHDFVLALFRWCIEEQHLAQGGEAVVVGYRCSEHGEGRRGDRIVDVVLTSTFLAASGVLVCVGTTLC